MDMYESLYVIPSTNTMKSWSDFAQYFKNLRQQYVAKSTKNVIFLAHLEDIYNETEMVMQTKVPIKGSLKKNGIESYFTDVISTKKITLKDLKDYSNNLLTFTPKEKELGYKHVFQTNLTKTTINERISGSMGLWSTEETYINNDIQLVLDRLHQYYI